MTITLPLAPIVNFVLDNPWPTVALVFLLGVVLPAVWSSRRRRQRAALAVIRAIVEPIAAIAAAVRASLR